MRLSIMRGSKEQELQVGVTGCLIPWTRINIHICKHAKQRQHSTAQHARAEGASMPSTPLAPDSSPCAAPSSLTPVPGTAGQTVSVPVPHPPSPARGNKPAAVMHECLLRKDMPRTRLPLRASLSLSPQIPTWSSATAPLAPPLCA